MIKKVKPDVFEKGKLYTYEQIEKILNNNIDIAIKKLEKQHNEALKGRKDPGKELYIMLQVMKTTAEICYYKNIVLGDES